MNTTPIPLQGIVIIIGSLLWQDNLGVAYNSIGRLPYI